MRFASPCGVGALVCFRFCVRERNATDRVSRFEVEHDKRRQKLLLNVSRVRVRVLLFSSFVRAKYAWLQDIPRVRLEGTVHGRAR